MAKSLLVSLMRKDRNGFVRRFSAGLLGALLLSNSCWAAAAASAGGPAGSLAGLTAPTNSPPQRMAVAVQQIQTRCAGVIQKVTNFLFEDGDANFSVQPLGQPVDQWPIVITIESYHPAQGQTRFSTVVVNPASGCSGMYEQVVNWDDSCANIKTKVFGAYKNEAIFLKQVHVSETGPGVQLYMMPAGKGCTSIKKELFR
jgi:hypothetical protein